MSILFDRAVEFVLRFEGDLSDDPHDPGRITKFGISQKAYPDVDIRALTRREAIELYRRDYWMKCKCDHLPAPLAMILFDSAVNQGPRPAVRMLQQALSVRVDGVVGAETIAAGHRASLRLVAVEFIARRGFQYALHPQVSRFGLGWYRRLAACHQVSQEPL